jgi:histidinol dehydrogenase
MKIISYEQINEIIYEYKEYVETDVVKDIIQKIRQDGDQAIKEISAQFGEQIEHIELTESDIAKSIAGVSEETMQYLKKAIKNIRNFAEKQLDCLKPLEYSTKGSTLGHKLVPLERVGAYVPGGNYPLPSSALMTVIPAKVAGVKEVIVCSPKVHDVTVVAARLAGADRIFRIGGAQAIAAMAYGTESVPPVDKIVGPGNKYVTQAKKEVYGKCGIDFLAGPSEIMIIADESASVPYIAADLLSQAEHDTDASSILVTYSHKFAETVIAEVYRQLELLPTKDIARQALDNSFVIIVNSLDQAVLIANKKAPEHLQLCFDKAEKLMGAFINYGSLFVGNYSAEVFGDYCSGTNHTLPTNGVARYSGGLSVFDFVKIQTYQIISEEAAKQQLISVASHLADVEGLMAHKNAARLRRGD